MEPTLAKRLGRTSILGVTFRNIARIEPDTIRMPFDISELGMAARSKDREAIAELGRILTGHPSYARQSRAALLEGMSMNEDLRGFVELYANRWEIELSVREANMIISCAGLACESILDKTHTRKEIFNEVVSSLLAPQEIQTRGVTGPEREFLLAFLSRPHFPALEIDYYGKPTVPKSTDYLAELQANLSEFVDQHPQLSDAFFDVARQLAERYASMSPNHYEQHRCTDYAVPFRQLSALIREPRILSDPRFDKTLEIAAGMAYAAPFSLRMFVHRTESGYSLNANVADNLAGAAERFALNPKIWKEPTGDFMASVAEALALIAQNDPEGTRKARFAMLLGTLDYHEKTRCGYLLNLLAPTFRSEEERRLLGALAADPGANCAYRDWIPGILERDFDKDG